MSYGGKKAENLGCPLNLPIQRVKMKSWSCGKDRYQWHEVLHRLARLSPEASRRPHRGAVPPPCPQTHHSRTLQESLALSVTKSHKTCSCDSRTGPVFRDPFPTHIFNGLSLASLFSPSSIPLGRHQPRRGKPIAMSPLLYPLPKPSSPCQRGHRIISQVQELLQNPGIVPAECCGGKIHRSLPTCCPRPSILPVKRERDLEEEWL